MTETTKRRPIIIEIPNGPHSYHAAIKLDQIWQMGFREGVLAVERAQEKWRARCRKK
jgi:hypothetical protein